MSSMLWEDLLCLLFPFLFWVAQVLIVQLEQTCKCPNFRNYWGPDWCEGKMGLCIPVLPVKVHTDTSTHQSYLFTSWTVLFPGGKTSSGYSSRGFISRAKVKAIKYSIVIIFGEWKAPQLLAREDADIRKLLFLSNLYHQQTKAWRRSLTQTPHLPSDLVLPLSPLLADTFLF